MSWIAIIIIGGIAGWLAGIIMKSKSEGIIWNILLGIIGGFAGGWLFGLLGYSGSSGWIGSIITATIGAVILIFVYRKLAR